MAHARHRAARAERTTYRMVLANREFAALFASHVLSIVGDQFAKVAVALLVFNRSHSAFLAAVIYAATFLPWIVAGPLTGPLTDRLPRRSVLIFCDLSRAVLVLGLCVPGMPIAGLIALIALISLLEPPFRSARAAMVPVILDDEERYVVGTALMRISEMVAQVLGFGAGGALVAFLSVRGTLLFDLFTFLASALLITFRVRSRAAASAESRGMLIDAAQGVRYVFADRSLRSLTLLAWVGACFTVVTEGVAVAYAHAHRGGAFETGLLTAAQPLGIAVGALVIGRWGSAAQRERWMLPMAVLGFLPMVLTGLDPLPWVAGLDWFLTGVAGAFMITLNAVYIRHIPDARRGAAFGVVATGLYAGQGLTLALAGLLAERLGAAHSVAIFGVAGFVSVLALWVAWPARAGESPTSSFVAIVSTKPETGGDMTAGADDVTVPERAPRSRVRRDLVTWGYTVLLAVAVGAVALHYRTAGAFLGGHRVPWWALVPVLLFTGATGIAFELRRQSHIVELTQLPLVFGLAFVSPLGLILARVASTLISSAIMRRGPLKLAFNVSVFAAGTAAAVVVFRLLAPATGTVSVHVWPAILGATLAEDVVGALAVAAVLKVQDPDWRPENLVRVLGFSSAVTIVTTSLAIVGVSSAFHQFSTVWVLLLFVVLSVLSFRGYQRLTTRHAALNRLYGFARSLGPMASDIDELVPALDQARDLLHAEELELSLGMAEGERTTVITVGEGWHGATVEDRDGPFEDAVVEILASSQARAWYSRARRNFRMRTGRHDNMMAVTLSADNESIGVLRCIKRLGELRGFDGEDLHLLEAIGGQLSTALEKGKLLASLRRAAQRDSLTDLPNLETTRRTISTMVADAHSDRTGLVVLYIDLDRLQDVNDTLGHEAGDLLLVEIARRLTNSASLGAFIGRVGGDEFVMAIPGRAGADVARLAALAVKSRLDGPVRLHELSTDISTTIGIARCPEHGTDASTLLRRGEMAMSAAKGAAGATAEWEPTQETAGSRRLQLVPGLRRALQISGLEVAYQPKLALGTGKVVGLEALARWRHPLLGHVSPTEFIPLAETSGLIGALTSTVLRRAVENCRSWHDAGLRVGVSVNLSARSLTDPALVGQVAAILTASALDPQWLTLELTESSVMENPTRSIEVLRQLRSLGVRLAIDDFGTGYSSLTYVKGLPVHEVKVDKAFVDHVHEDSADRAVLRAIVELSRSLGLVAVAEGVETPEQAAVLTDLGLDEVQGYLYARPMSGSNTMAWLHARLGQPSAVESPDMPRG